MNQMRIIKKNCFLITNVLSVLPFNINKQNQKRNNVSTQQRMFFSNRLSKETVIVSKHLKLGETVSVADLTHTSAGERSHTSVGYAHNRTKTNGSHENHTGG